MSYGSRALLCLVLVGAGCSAPELEPEAVGGRAFASPVSCGRARGLPQGVTLDRAHFQLDCGLDVSLPEAGIVRIGRAQSSPSYAVVARPEPVELAYGQDAGALVVCTSELVVTVRDCLVSASDNDGHLLYEQLSEAAYRAEPGDHFYGLGEATGALDRRGSIKTLWNTDAYVPAIGGYPVDADPLYQSIPFLITLRDTRALGVFTDDWHKLRYDVAAGDAMRVQVTSEGGPSDRYLVAGPSLAEVTRRYTWLTGRMPLPPRWALGYHQSRWGYYPHTRVREVAAEFRKRDIPADGLWLDIQHMDGFRSFTWDANGFPDPAALMRDLESDGWKTVVIADPGIKVDPGWDIYDSGLAGSHYIKGPDGKPFVGEVWPGAAVFPDFTSAQTRDWWSLLVARDARLGARGLWIDMNEPASFTTPVPIDTHNVYALLEAQATWDGLRMEKPERRPMVLSRAAFAGQQRYSAVWTGDAPSTFATLRATLPMLLGLGLSGLTFAGSDVGGYSGHASAELFARWMQLGAISPFFRAHVTTGVNDQEPWAFGPEVEDVSRAAIVSRYELMPYLYSLFHQATLSGAPVLRALVYEFQSDPKTHALDDQAMLGPSLMFAPVLDAAKSTRPVYFPAGRWYEITSGALVEGPTTRDVPVTLGALPGWVREGAILVRQPSMPYTDHHAPDQLLLDVYPSDRKETFVLYEDAGDGSGASSEITYALDATRLSVSKRQGTYQPPQRALTIRVHRVDHPPKSVTFAGSGVWSYDDNDRAIVITMPDRDDFTVELDYDHTISDAAPVVAVPIDVEVPAGTPGDISIATSVSGWTHQMLTRSGDRATGTVSLPRGAWFEYKYARGGWSTVEKSATCGEIANRSMQAAARPANRDKVAAFVDRCP